MNFFIRFYRIFPFCLIKVMKKRTKKCFPLSLSSVKKNFFNYFSGLEKNHRMKPAYEKREQFNAILTKYLLICFLFLGLNTFAISFLLSISYLNIRIVPFHIAYGQTSPPFFDFCTIIMISIILEFRLTRKRFTAFG